MSVHCVCAIFQRPERTLGNLELLLQTVVSHNVDPGTTKSAVNTDNYQAIFQATLISFLHMTTS